MARVRSDCCCWVPAGRAKQEGRQSQWQAGWCARWSGLAARGVGAAAVGGSTDPPIRAARVTPDAV